MKYDVIIIGGGIVGLATGYQLLKKSPDLKCLVVEKEKEIATHQTGHNSGVIHSGIYYKPGSKKAGNCREGVQQLIQFCDRHDIKYELCGKIIVATNPEEIPVLENLYERGKANQVPEITLINSDTIKELESHVVGLKAIHSPQTGIIHYPDVCKKLAEQFVAMGGVIQFDTKVFNILEHSIDLIIETDQGAFTGKIIVNCAGLYADKIAQLTGFGKEMQIIPFRGEYYTIKPTSHYLVKNLIYPVPDPRFPFLGVHFTRSLDGSIEAGPNAVLALAREGYTKSDINLGEIFDYLRFSGFYHMAFKYWNIGMKEQWRSYVKKAFVKSLRKLIPEITQSDLQAGGAGVRAQALTRTGRLVDDFYIDGNKRMVHVLNAPSPAATSSFAIGSEISDLVLAQE